MYESLKFCLRKSLLGTNASQNDFSGRLWCKSDPHDRSVVFNSLRSVLIDWKSKNRGNCCKIMSGIWNFQDSVSLPKLSVNSSKFDSIPQSNKFVNLMLHNYQWDNRDCKHAHKCSPNRIKIKTSCLRMNRKNPESSENKHCSIFFCK